MKYILFFFFSSRRRHTRCGRDWSSDVCSSDLPGDREGDPQPAGGLERPVGQVAVEADRDAEPGDRVHHGADGHVAPVQPATPGDRYRDDQRQEGNDHESPERDQDSGRLLAFGERLGAALFGRLVEYGTGHDGTSKSITYAYVTVTYGTVVCQRSAGEHQLSGHARLGYAILVEPCC